MNFFKTQNKKKEKNFDSNKIDEDLYSRQIIFLGMETMKKISKLNILIIGIRGLGIEIAKNIIVSGPKKLTIFDPNKVNINDLGSNFYLTNNDIGKRRDESCIKKLQKLNKYVEVNYFKEKNINEIINKIVNNFNVIVVSEIISKKHINLLNNISRKNKICFIYSAICGLSSFIFSDFGPDFTIYDEYCKKKRKFFIKNIEKSEKGLVEIQLDKNKNPYINKHIIFKDVEGMTEINYNENNKKIFEIEFNDDDYHTFYIGNTMNYSDYKSGGYIEETSLPKKISYNSFKDKLEEPFTNNDIYINSKKKFIFLVFKALMEFYDKNERLPFLNDKNDYEELNKITKNIYDNINYDKLKSFEKDELNYNEQIIKNMCFTATAEIPCMTSLVGGAVCQEIIKATGKFRPIEQWEIFDFLQYSYLVPEDEKSKFYNLNINNKYDELISIFGKKIILILQSLNILLAGAGALGCELLKNLSLFGISDPGSVLVIDDDNIELSNLNRQFLFHEENKGKSKAYIACQSAKEINNELNCNYIPKRISPENKNIFNKSYFKNVDFVLGAIDSNQGNYYLVKQCELNKKIFIKGGTYGPSGKVETFIPDMTCSYNNIKYVGQEEEKLPSCTRREFPGKIEDCIDNARDLFDDYFVTLIYDLQNIINEKEKLVELEVQNSMDKFNIMYNYICLINKDIQIKTNKETNKIIKFMNFFKKKNINEENDIEKELIKFGLKEYDKLFINNVKKIYSAHPLNETEESQLFWTNKRQPKELVFNIDDELSINFLFNFLKITANLLEISFNNNLNNFKIKLTEILKDKNNNLDKIDYYINNSEILFKTILDEINKIKQNNILLNKFKNLKKTEFEKDIPELGHIQFIHSYSNLKAKSYKIPYCDKFYTLEYVGKVAPTSITSTSVVAGLMCLQMIGVIINKLYIWPKKNIDKNNDNNNFDDIDDEELIDNGLHNFCFNLKNNNFSFEPLHGIEYDGKWNINDLISQKFSRWDQIIEIGDKTIKEFNQYIKNKYGVTVTLILSAEDDRDIFEFISLKRKNKKSQLKRLQMEKISNLKLEDIYFETAQKICKDYEKDNEIFLKVKGITDDNNYVEFPVIKYEIKNI